MPNPLAGLPKELTKPTTGGAFKMVLNGVMSAVGMYYLAVGKKESDVDKMLLGAGLILAALFLF